MSVAECTTGTQGAPVTTSPVELPRVVAVPLPPTVYAAIRVVARHVNRSPGAVVAALLTWKAAERQEVAAPPLAPPSELERRIAAQVEEWWVPPPTVAGPPRATPNGKRGAPPLVVPPDADQWRARLRNARVRLVWTQHKAGEYLGMSRSMLHDLETGGRLKHPAVSRLVEATERLEAALAQERGW